MQTPKSHYLGVRIVITQHLFKENYGKIIKVIMVANTKTED